MNERKELQQPLGDPRAAGERERLIAKWRAQADRERKFDMPLGGRAIGRGIAGVFDNCADELEVALQAEAAAAPRSAPLDEIERIAKRACSGEWSEGQIAYEIQMIVEQRETSLRADVARLKDWHDAAEEECAELSGRLAESPGADPRSAAPVECAHGHKKRVVGCVSCVLVFDKAAAYHPYHDCKNGCRIEGGLMHFCKRHQPRPAGVERKA